MGHQTISAMEAADPSGGVDLAGSGSERPRFSMNPHRRLQQQYACRGWRALAAKVMARRRLCLDAASSTPGIQLWAEECVDEVLQNY